MKWPAPSEPRILDGEVKQLQRRLIIGKTSARLDDLAQRAVHRLYRVRGVDHLANSGGKGKKWNDMLPGSAPDLADCRVALAPFGFELLKTEERHLGIIGVVDRLDGRHDRAAVS